MQSVSPGSPRPRASTSAHAASIARLRMSHVREPQRGMALALAQRHHFGTRWLKNLADQAGQRCESLSLLRLELVAIICAADSTNDVPKGPLRMVGAYSGPAHQRARRAAQIVVGPAQQWFGIRLMLTH